MDSGADRREAEREEMAQLLERHKRRDPYFQETQMFGCIELPLGLWLRVQLAIVILLLLLMLIGQLLKRTVTDGGPAPAGQPGSPLQQAP